jgi:hypothetical protein
VALRVPGALGLEIHSRPELSQQCREGLNKHCGNQAILSTDQGRKEKPLTGKVFLGGWRGSRRVCEGEWNVSETWGKGAVPILSSIDTQVTTYTLTTVWEGGEMTQTLYAHMNKIKIKKKRMS